VGRKSGITEQQLRELGRFEESAAFSTHERLVLRLAMGLTSTPANVDDALFAELRREFDEPQLAELTMAIAWENGRARFNRTFAIGAEGFSEGAFCALPERRDGGSRPASAVDAHD
jgi:alkylhydroperoxidase family enzyme